MSNWVVFNTVGSKPVNLAVNLDMVKTIQNGSVANTVSLDGTLVAATVAQVMLMVTHVVYPGAIGAPLTSA